MVSVSKRDVALISIAVLFASFVVIYTTPLGDKLVTPQADELRQYQKERALRNITKDVDLSKNPIIYKPIVPEPPKDDIEDIEDDTNTTKNNTEDDTNTPQNETKVEQPNNQPNNTNGSNPSEGSGDSEDPGEKGLWEILKENGKKIWKKIEDFFQEKICKDRLKTIKNHLKKLILPSNIETMNPTTKNCIKLTKEYLIDKVMKKITLCDGLLGIVVLSLGIALFITVFVPVMFMIIAYIYDTCLHRYE